MYLILLLIPICFSYGFSNQNKYIKVISKPLTSNLDSLKILEIQEKIINRKSISLQYHEETTLYYSLCQEEFNKKVWNKCGEISVIINNLKDPNTNNSHSVKLINNLRDSIYSVFKLKPQSKLNDVEYIEKINFLSLLDTSKVLQYLQKSLISNSWINKLKLIKRKINLEKESHLVFNEINQQTKTFLWIVDKIFGDLKNHVSVNIYSNNINLIKDLWEDANFQESLVDFRLENHFVNENRFSKIIPNPKKNSTLYRLRFLLSDAIWESGKGIYPISGYLFSERYRLSKSDSALIVNSIRNFGDRNRHLQAKADKYDSSSYHNPKWVILDSLIIEEIKKIKELFSIEFKSFLDYEGKDTIELDVYGIHNSFFPSKEKLVEKISELVFINGVEWLDYHFPNLKFPKIEGGDLASIRLKFRNFLKKTSISDYNLLRINFSRLIVVPYRDKLNNFKNELYHKGVKNG